MTDFKHCVSACAWLLSTAAAALTPEEARHFQLRTQLAIHPLEQTRLLKLSRRQAVRQLLQSYQPQRRPVLTGPGRVALQTQWLTQLLTSRSPFTERLLLFWHNLLASRLQPGDSVRLLQQRHQQLQAHGLGRYDQLLLALSRLPKAHYPQGFARLLLDVTLGAGNYQATDLATAERVFSRPHSNAVRAMFLGSHAAWQPASLIRTLLSDRRSSERLVRMLWRSFISAQPVPGRVAWLARQFRDAGYRLDVLLRMLLDEPAFWSPVNRGQLVKSPLMLLVSTGRSLQLTPGPYVAQWLRLSARWGAPVLTGSWSAEGPRGPQWLASGRLQQRQRWLAALVRAPQRHYRQPLQRFNRQVPDAEKAGRLMHIPEALPVRAHAADYTAALLQMPEFQYY